MLGERCLPSTFSRALKSLVLQTFTSTVNLSGHPSVSYQLSLLAWLPLTMLRHSAPNRFLKEASFGPLEEIKFGFLLNHSTRASLLYGTLNDDMCWKYSMPPSPPEYVLMKAETVACSLLNP